MTTRVQKWGNSLAVRIPKACAEQAALGEGTVVSVRFDNGALLVRPVALRVPSLAELLEGITPENVHPEVDWGPPVGKEIW